MTQIALRCARTNKAIIYTDILPCPARIRHHSELVQHASTDLSNNFNMNFPKGLVRDAIATVAR